MSTIICKIRNADRILIKTGILNINAFYSRRSNSKNSDSHYKVVKSKIRLDDESDVNSSEGGPNWELFAPKGNRFYLPGSLGLAWQSSSTTASTDFNLEKLVDFESKKIDKLHINSKACPVLLRNNLHELFPAPEVYQKGALTLITLSYNSNAEVEQGAKNFVLAAREMCTRLRINGYWADFMNPFSGKPFYSYSSGRKLYKIDPKFRGLGIKFENHNNCLIISSTVKDVLGINATAAVVETTTDLTNKPATVTAGDVIADDTIEDVTFSGSVFTNAPTDLLFLQSILND